jgi:uncharacterized repeat protein (TIGR03899 family)
MEFNDVLGLGKILPIDKLIDVISKAVGTISKPYFDRRNVDTRVYEIEKLAEARAKEMKIITLAVKENFQSTGGIEYKEDKLSITSPKELPQEVQTTLLNNSLMLERIQERLNFQEAKKQLNIESITSFAAEALRDEQPITNEPLDEDWATRFFRIAEDISNEDIQALWGKILAGEIKQPKSFSLRTLELIRNLSKDEANLFMRVANFAIQSGNTNFIFNGENDELLGDSYNINYNDIAKLIEIGLIQTGDFINFQLSESKTDAKSVFIAGNIVIVAQIKANTPTIFFPISIFSTPGSELLKLIPTNPPFEYLFELAKTIRRENVDVKYGYILAKEENSVRHTNPLQDFQFKDDDIPST